MCTYISISQSVTRFDCTHQMFIANSLTARVIYDVKYICIQFKHKQHKRCAIYHIWHLRSYTQNAACAWVLL